MLMRSLIIFVGCLSLATGVWAGEVYKWVDENGKVHFSDKKPVTDAEKVDVSKSRVDSKSLSESQQIQRRQQRLLEAFDRDAAAKQRVAEQEAQQQQRQLQACNRARDQLNDLNNIERLYRLTDSGERHYLSEEERDGEREKVQAMIERFCDS